MFRSKGLATSPLSTSHESPQEEAEVEFQRSCHQEEERRQSAGAAGLHVCCENFKETILIPVGKTHSGLGGLASNKPSGTPQTLGMLLQGTTFGSWPGSYIQTCSKSLYKV